MASHPRARRISAPPRPRARKDVPPPWRRPTAAVDGFEEHARFLLTRAAPTKAALSLLPVAFRDSIGCSYAHSNTELTATSSRAAAVDEIKQAVPEGYVHYWVKLPVRRRGDPPTIGPTTGDVLLTDGGTSTIAVLDSSFGGPPRGRATGWVIAKLTPVVAAAAAAV